MGCKCYCHKEFWAGLCGLVLTLLFTVIVALGLVRALELIITWGD